MRTGRQTKHRTGARIVYDEHRRGWTIEVGPEPGHALLDSDRVIDTRAEAEQLLRLRGYGLQRSKDPDWPWQRIEEDRAPGDRPCVEDWVRSSSASLSRFERDER